jgi:hypothetical protein
MTTSAISSSTASTGLSITPSGLLFEHVAQDEAEFLYEEIFDRNCYLQHGLQVRDNNFVVDIGANIGLFSLYLMSKFENLSILCIEPIPKVFEVLER